MNDESNSDEAITPPDLRRPPGLRSGAIFLFANVFAGALHYLFQVFASRSLSAREFAELNAWFADLALFFLIGGLLQYASNFFPAPVSRLRQAVVAINLFAVATIFAWFMGEQGFTIERAILILAGSSLFGWLNGQVQARMMFGTMAVANILVAVSKIGIVLLPLWVYVIPEKYRFALFVCYVPALWYVSAAAWNAAEPRHDKVRVTPKGWRPWMAPLVLSTAAALIPQIDLVLMSRIQTPEVFDEFARASLFYKGIYFVMFIFAQWLLPQQVLAGDELTSGKRSFVLYFVGATLFSLLTAALAPFVATAILSWDHSPSRTMILLSCLNMSLMTWIFVLIQEACARGRVAAAGIAIAVFFVEGILQFGLTSSIIGYFALSIALHTGTIWFLGAKASRYAVLAPK